MTPPQALLACASTTSDWSLIELHCVEEFRWGLDGVNLVRLAHHFKSVWPDFVRFFVCDNYMINKCLAICDGRFVPSRMVGLSRVVQRSRQDRDVGAVYHLNDGNIEFCKKRPSMDLQFGNRLSAVAGSILGLFGAANSRVLARALPTLERTFYLHHWWCQQRALFRRLRENEP